MADTNSRGTNNEVRDQTNTLEPLFVLSVVTVTVGEVFDCVSTDEVLATLDDCVAVDDEVLATLDDCVAVDDDSGGEDDVAAVVLDTVVVASVLTVVEFDLAKGGGVVVVDVVPLVALSSPHHHPTHLFLKRKELV